MSTITTSTEEVNRLIAAMEPKNEEIESLFSTLEAGIEVTTELPPEERFKKIISMEYILLLLRVKISAEQCTVKKILTSPSFKSVNVLSFFKMRDTFLASNIQRLNEIQDAIALLQKSEYLKSSLNVYSRD